MQLAGVQDNGIEHQSDFVHKRDAILAKAISSDPSMDHHSTRKIDTFRMTVCPACDKEVYLDGIVLDSLDADKRIVSPPWKEYRRIRVMDSIPGQLSESDCNRQTPVHDGFPTRSDSGKSGNIHPPTYAG